MLRARLEQTESQFVGEEMDATCTDDTSGEVLLKTEVEVERNVASVKALVEMGSKRASLYVGRNEY